MRIRRMPRTFPFLVSALLCLAPSCVGAVPIALLSQVSGEVRMWQDQQQTTQKATEGALLSSNHHLRTLDDGKVTLLLRDGSEVRVLEKTQLHFIRKAERTLTPSGSLQITLYHGTLSAWFRQRSVPHQLTTPALSIESGKAEFQVQATKSHTSVAVASNSVRVRYRASTLMLKAGSRIYRARVNNKLFRTMNPVPHALQLQLVTPQEIPNLTTDIPIEFSVNLVRRGRNDEVDRPGLIRLTANYYGFDFPERVTLNRNGKAVVRGTLKPPHPEDRLFNGKVVIRATTDNLGLFGVERGTLSVTIPVSD